MVIHGLAHGLAPGSICMGRFGVDLLTLLEFLLNTGQIFASTMFYVSTAFILPVDLFFLQKLHLLFGFVARRGLCYLLGASGRSPTVALWPPLSPALLAGTHQVTLTLALKTAPAGGPPCN